MKKYRILLILLVLIPVIIPLLQRGFIATDDGDWMIIRFSAFHQEFIRGQIPVRWLGRLNHSYGYPVATFLYPGFMYAAEIPKLLGLGYIASVKAIIIGSIIFGALFVYRWLRIRFPSFPSFAGAVVYAYHPYLLYDIYIRGSVGEVLALGILPFAFWTIETNRVALYAFSVAALILSHNTMALLFFPILILYQLSRGKRNRGAAMKATLLGVGIAAFFWIPALSEVRHTAFSTKVLSDWEGYLTESWVAIQSGIVVLLIISGSLIFGVVRKRKPFLHYLHKNTALFIFLATFCTGVILALPISRPLWNVFPLGRFVQFPFRFLSYTVVSLPYITGAVYQMTEKRFSKRWAAALLLPFILIGFYYFAILNIKKKDVPDEFYSTNEATTTVQDEYMPVWAREKPQSRAEKPIVRIDGETVQINTIYWPGFHVFVDGVEQQIGYQNPQGLMRIRTTASIEKVRVIFRETPGRLAADTVSLVSLLIILGWEIRRKRTA